ncbi:MAG: HAD family hydrolase [Firmicutes bacterium]|nr:HAD family hydrolase [Bacillota bacterium]
MVQIESRKGQLWIFDMDGTLLDSAPLAVPAFHATRARMAQAGWEVPDAWSDDQVLRTFGMTHDHIWQQLLGYRLDHERQQSADRWLLEAEVSGLQEGRATLFTGVADTLRELHAQGASLSVASNGQQAYIEGIIEASGLTPLFAGLYSAAGRQTSTKVELVRQLLSEIPHQRAVMVGDRSSDVEAGLGNGLPVVGCAFGFADDGELAGASVRINRFAELLQLHPWL